MSSSETLTRYAKCDLVTLRLGEEHHLKLVFNQAEKGETVSLMPNSPLSIDW